METQRRPIPSLVDFINMYNRVYRLVAYLDNGPANS